MHSAPPDPDGLDSAWEDEDEGEGPEDASTRMIDSKELFERAGFSMEDVGGKEKERGELGEDESAPKRSGGRTTRPRPEAAAPEHRGFGRPGISQESPTIPRMLAPWAQPSVGENYEDTLDSLLQEKSADLECDEPGIASTPGPSAVRPTRPAPGQVPRPTRPVPAAPGQAPRPTRPAPGQAPRPTRPAPGQAPRPAPPLPDQELLEDDLLEGLDVSSPPRELPRAATSSGVGVAARPGAPEVDFNLDFEVPDLDMQEPGGAQDFGSGPPGTVPPATPPPGTLRYGLIEDDEPFSSTEDWGERVAMSSGLPRAFDPREHPPVSSAAQPGPGYASGPRRTESVRMATLIPGMVPDGPQAPSEPPPAAPAPPAPDDRRRQMLQRYEAGDYGGALVLAEAVLDEIPDDAVARRYAESCNEMLRQMYKARIGDGSQVLRIVMPSDELRSLNLDHRAGFLLSCIDGMSSIDDILDVSGMRELEALRILFELVQEHVIAPSDR